MRVAFATCSELPDGSPDDAQAAAALGADVAVWDDPAVDWDAYDRVILRSTWDYTFGVDAFLRWCRAVGPERLRNDADVVAFIHREEYYDRDNEDVKGKAEIIIAKQRNGPTGSIELAFLADFTRFENLASGDVGH